jgi:hypothetical protein
VNPWNRRLIALRSRRPVPLRVLVAASAVASVAAFCESRMWAPEDPVLHQDVLDHFTGFVADAMPRRPMILAGPDGRRGTPDDFIVPDLRGDLDLVVRAGMTDLSAPIETTPPISTAVAAANGLGSEIDFAVQAVAGWELSPLEHLAATSPSLDGNPVLALAFADLDADGRIGPTLRDGIARDEEAESAELVPVGMQMVTFANARASGRMRLLVGSPAAHPVRVALTAIAFSGPTDPAYFGGVVPIGSTLMTALPFLPPYDRADSIDAGAQGPEPATPDRPLGVEIARAFDPDPADPLWGGLLDLALDGSETSIDVVESVSTQATHFGVARSAGEPDYVQTERRPVRTGLDELGNPHAYEIAGRIHVADDGRESEVAVRIVPLDRLGNVADLAVPSSVELTTHGIVVIRWPDQDGDPHRETVLVSSAAGAAVLLDDRGGAFDDPLADRLVVAAAGTGTQVDLILPDADVNDSGTVDQADADEVGLRIGLDLADVVFEDRHDVDGNGRIERADEIIVRDRLRSAVTIP